jgi:hypothetical protein
MHAVGHSQVTENKWLRQGYAPGCCPPAELLFEIEQFNRKDSRAVSQLLWPDEDREVFLWEFGLHRLRNCLPGDEAGNA